MVTAPAPGGRTRGAWSPAALFPGQEVLLPWVVSRCYSVLLALAAASIGAGGGLQYTGLSKWDGAWYLQIAHGGYGPEPAGAVQTPWPFFPFLPGVLRAFDRVGLPERGAMLVVNELVFLVALAGVWRIARRHTGDGPARWAVWAIALFPGAFVFSMLYPSSIFLAASVWAFVLVEEKLDVVAAVPVAVTALVRPNGIVLAVALVFALRSWRRVAIVCGPAVVAVGAWAAWCWYQVGDPIVFLTSKEGWPEVTIKGFLTHPWDFDYVVPHLALAVVALGALWIVRRSLPASWTIFTALYLLPSLVLGMVGLGRYANECFPPFVAAGVLLERSRRAVQTTVVVVALVAQAFCVWWVIHDNYVP
jgi:hypothetical protein